MEYYFAVLKEKILYSPSPLQEMGWVAIGLAVVVVLAGLVMFGRNIRPKR